ncbi:MAG: exodeoxyribonuclease VII large subunit [Candidatus Aphodosoma sp.]
MPVTPVSISYLSVCIRQTIQRAIPQKFWIWGEINSMSVRGGHCYIDLVEKAENSDALVAKIRCNIWQWNWRGIEEKFRRETGESIRTGMTVQLLVQLEYHELYSMSVNASDIDPAYTLGALQRRKLQIIEYLRKNGLLQLNRRCPMPAIVKRIAVISSSQAAGYTDFLHQLNGNAYGFAYSTVLFQAVMQGTQTEKSVTAALQAVSRQAAGFDIVVIIRGGGATSDLYAFDSQLIAETCASMPLPVITGIGHQRDESILDMVAHTAMKTPTAVADFIIGHTKCFADKIDGLARRLSQGVALRLSAVMSVLGAYNVRIPAAANIMMQREYNRIARTVITLHSSALSLVAAHGESLNNRKIRIAGNAMKMIHSECNRLEWTSRSLPQNVATFIKGKQSGIELISTKLSLLDPRRLLRKGYSITMCNGKVVTDVVNLHKGDIITSIFANGKTESVIDGIHEDNEVQHT